MTNSTRPRHKSPEESLSAPGESQPPALPPFLRHDQIAARAVDIWLAKGRPRGCDGRTWLEAEEALKRERHLV